MGCWGYEPFDNDDAGDMIACLWDHVHRLLNAPICKANRHYYEARAAIELATVAAGTDILGGPNLQLGIDALDRILADEKWILDAKEPEGLRASILRQRRRVVRAMNRPRSKTLQKLFGTRKAANGKRARFVVVKGKRVRTTTTCAVVVRVNGKVCGCVALSPRATEEAALGAIANDRLIGEKISEQIVAGKRQRKILYVPGKTISFTYA